METSLMHRTPSFIRTAMLLPLALAACGDENAGKPARKLLTQVDAVAIVDAAEKIWASGDQKRIAALYAPSAVRFDPYIAIPTDSQETSSDWNKDFADLKLENMTVAHRHVQLLDQDTIISSGIGSATALIKGDRQSVSTRYSAVYERQPDGTWLIEHEHASQVPG